MRLHVQLGWNWILVMILILSVWNFFPSVDYLQSNEASKSDVSPRVWLALGFAKTIPQESYRVSLKYLVNDCSFDPRVAGPRSELGSVNLGECPLEIEPATCRPAFLKSITSYPTEVLSQTVLIYLFYPRAISIFQTKISTQEELISVQMFIWWIETWIKDRKIMHCC